MGRVHLVESGQVQLEWIVENTQNTKFSSMLKYMGKMIFIFYKNQEQTAALIMKYFRVVQSSQLNADQISRINVFHWHVKYFNITSCHTVMHQVYYSVQFTLLPVTHQVYYSVPVQFTLLPTPKKFWYMFARFLWHIKNVYIAVLKAWNFFCLLWIVQRFLHSKTAMCIIPTVYTCIQQFAQFPSIYSNISLLCFDKLLLLLRNNQASNIIFWHYVENTSYCTPKTNWFPLFLESVSSLLLHFSIYLTHVQWTCNF